MRERLFRFHYQTIVRFNNMIERHSFKLRCMPMECDFQKRDSVRFQLFPSGAELHHATDAFGNEIEYGSITEPHVSFIYQCSGMVRMSAYRIKDDDIPYIYHSFSALTGCSQEMKLWIKSLDDDGSGAGGGIEGWIGKCSHAVYKKMSYTPGTTNNATTAAQAFAIGSGVCQDYAHILIALCRLKGLAARYVNGFMTGTGMTHAWVEVYNGTEWIGIDPTNDRRISFGYIKVAQGRDAADCPVNRGVFSGNTSQRMEVEVRVEEI